MKFQRNKVIYEEAASVVLPPLMRVVDAYRFCKDNPSVNGVLVEVNGGYCYK